MTLDRTLLACTTLIIGVICAFWAFVDVRFDNIQADIRRLEAALKGHDDGYHKRLAAILTGEDKGK